MEDLNQSSGHWLSHFPDNYTSLVSLNIACLNSEVSFTALERLVGRCPNLRTLRLNRAVPLDRLAILLRRAPQLVELGTGEASDLRPDVFSKLLGAFSGCKELNSLSGFWDVAPGYLPVVYPICPRLTSLNLSDAATIQSSDLIKLVSQCQNLQKLWVCLVLYMMFFKIYLFYGPSVGHKHVPVAYFSCID